MVVVDHLRVLDRRRGAHALNLRESPDRDRSDAGSIDAGHEIGAADRIACVFIEISTPNAARVTC
jgi:hypothetical protein